MRYLTKVTEVYRLSSEEEVKVFLEELKQDPSFEVSRYSSVKKEKKQKGEIIDEWTQFTVTKLFNDEKDPINIVDITYDVK